MVCNGSDAAASVGAGAAGSSLKNRSRWPLNLGGSAIAAADRMPMLLVQTAKNKPRDSTSTIGITHWYWWNGFC